MDVLLDADVGEYHRDPGVEPDNIGLSGVGPGDYKMGFGGEGFTVNEDLVTAEVKVEGSDIELYPRRVADAGYTDGAYRVTTTPEDGQTTARYR